MMKQSEPTESSTARRVLDSRRGGFTLVEIMISLVVMSVILASAFQVMKGQSDFVAHQGATITANQTARTAAAVIASELREVAPKEGDLLVATETQITVRLMRKLGFACDVDSAGGRLSVWVQSEPFATGDSLSIFQDSLAIIAKDDHWIYRQVTAVDSISGGVTTCASWGAKPRARLTMATFRGVGRGAEVRSFERLTYGVFNIDGTYVFGRQAPGSDPEMLLGPLPGARGIRLTYMDSVGTVLTPSTAAIRARVRRVRIVARGTAKSQSGTFNDSLVTQVYLRNN